MLAHKGNGEDPVTYSKLLFADQTLERWTEARDPLLPKNTTVGSSNISCSHSQGKLFPSRKFKGNHNFTAKLVAVEDHETVEDSGPKSNGEKKADSSGEENAGMSGEAGDIDPSLGYITWFANVIELYQKRTAIALGVEAQIT